MHRTLTWAHFCQSLWESNFTETAAFTVQLNERNWFSYLDVARITARIDSDLTTSFLKVSLKAHQNDNIFMSVNLEEEKSNIPLQFQVSDVEHYKDCILRQVRATATPLQCHVWEWFLALLVDAHSPCFKKVKR